jgi:2-dehydropantoate 2-reductase
MMRQLFEEISPLFNGSETDWERIIEICKRTGKNRSSMLKDIEEGRETEIDAITGVILEKASLKNHLVPLNQFLFNSVKGLALERKEDVR